MQEINDISFFTFSFADPIFHSKTYRRKIGVDEWLLKLGNSDYWRVRVPRRSWARSHPLARWCEAEVSPRPHTPDWSSGPGGTSSCEREPAELVTVCSCDSRTQELTNLGQSVCHCLPPFTLFVAHCLCCQKSKFNILLVLRAEIPQFLFSMTTIDICLAECNLSGFIPRKLKDLFPQDSLVWWRVRECM